jgi:hypothetical protein
MRVAFLSGLPHRRAAARKRNHPWMDGSVTGVRFGMSAPKKHKNLLSAAVYRVEGPRLEGRRALVYGPVSHFVRRSTSNRPGVPKAENGL